MIDTFGSLVKSVESNEVNDFNRLVVIYFNIANLTILFCLRAQNDYDKETKYVRAQEPLSVITYIVCEY
jgi:phosphopantetheine adenylyltransferase